MDPGQDTLPSNAPTTLLRPAHAQRVNGVDLKAAEQVTRRLLLSEDTIPSYYLMPDLDGLCPPPIHRFLYRDGFASLHAAIDPAYRGQSEQGRQYGAPQPRAARKRAQIANLVAAVATVASLRSTRGVKRPRASPRKILDMCGGCGHVGLALAALLPNWQVVVVDVRPIALQVVMSRAQDASLVNITTVQRNIEELGDLTFDIAVALHACGGASDIVLASAARARAAVVVAPCCVGGVVSTKGSVTGNASGAQVVDPVSQSGAIIDWAVPRSALFRSLLRTGEYSRLARAADFSEQLSGRDDWRCVAKSLLEQDRALWMAEAQYEFRLVKMKPLSCTPKNDILISWPREQTLDGGYQSDLGWDLDMVCNKFLQDVRDGSVMKGLGATEVGEIEDVLNAEVCAETSSGQYKFPKGLGKRKRKVIHAVAESMGLWHGSAGKGAERCISVRRTSWWPLFFESFLGIGGPAIEQLCNSLIAQIPTHCVTRRALLRGNPHHITIIRPPEVPRLPYRYKGDRAMLLGRALTKLKGSRVKAFGIGRVVQQAPATSQPSMFGRIHGKDDFEEKRMRQDMSCEENEAYFIVVHWPAANDLRRELGLPPSDLHVTLGFKMKDIHGIRKDRSTIVFERESEFALW